MSMNGMASSSGTGHEASPRDARAQPGLVTEAFQGFVVMALGSASLIGIAYCAMVLLTSPDGWIMKAASQAMATAQHGTLASYTVAEAQ